MNKLSLAGAVAAVALTGAFALSSLASAEPAPKWDPAKFHQAMCTDHYARALSHLTYLETKLNLDAAQRLAWTQFHDVVAANAKTDEEACLTRPAPSRDHHPSVVEGSLFIQKRLEAKLAELKTTQPYLETLYGVLNADQKMTFNHAAFRAFGEHRRHGHDHDGRHRGHDGKPGMGSDHGPDAPIEQ